MMAVTKSRRYIAAILTAYMAVHCVLLSGCTPESDRDQTGSSEEAVTSIHIEPDLSESSVVFETQEDLSPEVTSVVITTGDDDMQQYSLSVEGLNGDPDYALKSALNHTQGIHRVSSEQIGGMYYCSVRADCASPIVTDSGYSISRTPVSVTSSTGQIVLLDYSDGSVAGTVNIPSQLGVEDFFLFEKDGQLYLEADRYNDYYYSFATEINYYSVDIDTMTIGEEADPFNVDDIYVAMEAKTPEGECFVVSDPDEVYNNRYLYIYTDGHEDPEVIDLMQLFGTDGVYVQYVAYYEDHTLAVKANPFYSQGEELSALINYGQKAIDEGRISESFPAELRSANSAITDADYNTYFFDDNGAIKVDTQTGEFGWMLSYADTDLACMDYFYTYPASVNSDGSVSITGLDFSDWYGTAMVTNYIISPDEDMSDDRETINILYSGYIDEYIAEYVDGFNAANTEYRARLCMCYPMTISNVEVAYAAEDVALTEEDAYLALGSEYSDSVASNEHLASILSGDNDIDVFISYGAQPEFQRAGLFEDLRDLMDDYEEQHPDELFYNIIDAAGYNDELYQIPLMFYFNGILSAEEITQADLDDNGIDGTVTTGEINVVSMNMDNYALLTDRIIGTDPVSYSLSSVEYLNELMSGDYMNLTEGNSGILNTDMISDMADDIVNVQNNYDGGWVEEYEYVTVTSIDSLIWSGLGGDGEVRSFISFPASDSAITVGAFLTEAVVAGTDDPEGARGFIEYVLGAEPSDECLYQGRLLINKAAFRNTLDVYLTFSLTTSQITRVMDIIEDLADCVSGMYYIDVDLRNAVFIATSSAQYAFPADLADLISENYQS